MIDEPVRLIGNSATALSLIVVGMGLSDTDGQGFKEERLYWAPLNYSFITLMLCFSIVNRIRAG